MKVTAVDSFNIMIYISSGLPHMWWLKETPGGLNRQTPRRTRDYFDLTIVCVLIFL